MNKSLNKKNKKSRKWRRNVCFDVFEFQPFGVNAIQYHRRRAAHHMYVHAKSTRIAVSEPNCQPSTHFITFNG